MGVSLEQWRAAIGCYVPPARGSHKECPYRVPGEEHTTKKETGGLFVPVFTPAKLNQDRSATSSSSRHYSPWKLSKMIAFILIIVLSLPVPIIASSVPSTMTPLPLSSPQPDKLAVYTEVDCYATDTFSGKGR